MRIRIREIEIFLQVVDSGSFVAAARSLLIDPASVSRAIKGLEQDLSVALFTRSTRSLKLTEEGRRFHRAAGDMLHSFDKTVGGFRAEVSLQAQLKIGMGPALSRRMLLRALPSFQNHHPNSRLVLVSVNDPAQIGDEGLDVFIRPRSNRQRGGEHKIPQGLVMRKLMDSSYVICASPDYLKRAGTPHTPDDLSGHSCMALLTLERDVQDEWPFAKSGVRKPFKFSPKLIADGEALREAALAGYGIIKTLACNVDSDVRAGTLVPLLPGWDLGGLPIIALYRKAKPTHSRINLFVRHLAQTFAKRSAY